MPGTERAPGRTSKFNKDKSDSRIRKFLTSPLWVGIGAIAAVLAIGGAVAAVIAILPGEQHATQSASISLVQFSNLSKVTISRFGLVFSYPSNWDQQYLPEDADGAAYVNPNDTAVSITGSGISGPLTPYPTIFDVEKQWKSLILSLRSGRIIEETATGATVQSTSGDYPVDAWRVVYEYVNDKGRSMTDMVKTAYANGREVDLVMEAPTREFPRYEQAFLQLSYKLLLLEQCQDCSAQ